MTNTRDPDAEGEPERLPYEPPAVVSEEVFETLALACGKVAGPMCEAQGPAQS